MINALCFVFNEVQGFFYVIGNCCNRVVVRKKFDRNSFGANMCKMHKKKLRNQQKATFVLYTEWGV